MSLSVINTHKLKETTPIDVLEKYEAALKEFVESIRTDQPNTWVYTVMRDAHDPLSFTHYAIYKDEKARTTHRDDPAVTKTKQIIRGYVETHFYSRILTVVASQSVLSKPSDLPANKPSDASFGPDEPF